MMKPRPTEVILGWGASSHSFLLVLPGSLLLAGIPGRGRRAQGALELWYAVWDVPLGSLWWVTDAKRPVSSLSCAGSLGERALGD